MERRLLLRDKREQLGINQRAVEIEIDYPAGSLSRIEKGRIPVKDEALDLIDAALDSIALRTKGEEGCEGSEQHHLASSSVAT